ncbi:MAG: four helix bundle protein [Lacibacter sp.]
MSLELENRFYKFSEGCRDFCKVVKWDTINTEYIRQLIRSSGSVSANFIEASDDLGKADEKMKLKVARRETKESILWLRLMLIYDNEQLEVTRKLLLDEAEQIRKILSAIINKLGG